MHSVPHHGRAPVHPGFLPLLIQTIENPPQNKWKIRLCALETVEATLVNIHKQTPSQVKSLMASLVKVLVTSCKDARKEVKEQAAKSLAHVGKMVTCNEIAAVSEKVINCLVNFGNSSLATETLYLIANTTFLSYVDAASFALLYPIAARAMKERDFSGKKNGIMIVGAAVVLIEDPLILEPYMPDFLPQIKELALDPTFEIAREAAKTLASMGKNVEGLFDDDLLPWAMAKLESCGGGDPHHALNERNGAAIFLSEAVACQPQRYEDILMTHIAPRLLVDPLSTSTSPQENKTFPERRHGGYAALETLCRTDGFEVFARDRCFMWVLHGLQDPSFLVHDVAYTTGQTMVQELGGLSADFFALPLADAILSFPDQPATRDSLSPKGMALGLFRKLIEKVSEARKFGQDMLSMDCCSWKTRLVFVCLLLITRGDDDHEVRRQSNKLLSEQIQSIIKAHADVRPEFLGCLKAITESSKESKSGVRKRRQAENALVKEFELFSEDEEERSAERKKQMACADPSKNVLPDLDWDALVQEQARRNEDLAAGAKASTVAQTSSTTDQSSPPTGAPGRASKNVLELEHLSWAQIPGFLNAWLAHHKDLAGKFANARTPLLSCILEAKNAETALSALRLEKLASLVDEKTFNEQIKNTLVKEIFNKYSPKKRSSVQDEADVLCHVEDLILMYGGGNKLLQDTTLELRKNRRYGVVGRNGTGKTTLMNLIADKGVPGISEVGLSGRSETISPGRKPTTMVFLYNVKLGRKLFRSSIPRFPTPPLVRGGRTRTRTTLHRPTRFLKFEISRSTWWNRAGGSFTVVPAESSE